jgi:hypothetical protein
MIQLVPLARDQCRVSLTYEGAKIIAIEWAGVRSPGIGSDLR